MDPSPADAASGGRSAAALRAIITWTLSAVNSRGDFPKIDPNIVLDSSTLRRVGKAVAVYSTKPLVNGAVVLLEIFARIILLLIFLALSFSPSRRTVVVNRMRITLEGHVNSVRRCERAAHLVPPRTNGTNTPARPPVTPPPASPGLSPARPLPLWRISCFVACFRNQAWLARDHGQGCVRQVAPAARRAAAHRRRGWRRQVEHLARAPALRPQGARYPHTTRRARVPIGGIRAAGSRAGADEGGVGWRSPPRDSLALALHPPPRMHARGPLDWQNE